MKSLLPIASLCLLVLVVGFVPSLRAVEPGRAFQVQGAQVEVVQVQAGAAVGRANSYEQMIAARGWVLPAEVDATDPLVRMLVLLPSGPLVVSVELLIDGRPFLEHREEMVRQVFHEGDTDQDGQLTWKELAECPHVDRFRTVLQRNPKTYDLDQDDHVSRRELRYLFAMMYGGAGLTLSPYSTGNVAGGVPLLDLLDLDGDRSLSPQEIEQAAERIRSRDADDNEIVTQQELLGRPIYGARGGGTYQAGQANHYVRHLTAETDWNGLLSLLQERYGGERRLSAESFAVTPELFTTLDANQNGHLQADELPALLSTAPHLDIRAELGKLDEGAEAVQLRSASGSLSLADHAISGGGRRLTMQLANTLLRFEALQTPDYSANFQQQAERIMQLLDKDKNGYIDDEEAKVQPGLASQFTSWDADQDGKVYAKEIADGYLRQQTPRLHQVTIMAAEPGYPLLAEIDRNGDGRLTLRELRDASALLRGRDANQDGRLDADEVPRTVELSFSRSGYGAGGYAARTYLSPSSPAAARGPDWFISMDRNADGDVSRNEFLGTNEQFSRLDQDGDQLISLEEASG